MENQVTTIICPNCGANTSNMHNCEFCGSYLVQKASLGIDMNGYLQTAKGYYSEGLEKVFQIYASILVKHNLSAGLYVNFSTPEKVTLPALEPTESCGIQITIPEVALERSGLVNRFKNSNVFKAFTVVEGYGFNRENGKVDLWYPDINTPEETRKYHMERADRTVEFYLADFGIDYSGAALVFNQLAKDVFQTNPEDIIIDINDGIDSDSVESSHSAQYNMNGDFLYGRGDGANQFVTVDGIKENLTAVDNSTAGDSKNDSNSSIWKILEIIAALFAIVMLIIYYCS